jgi:hypothetical protein
VAGLARAVLGGNRRGGGEGENGDQAAMNTTREELWLRSWILTNRCGFTNPTGFRQAQVRRDATLGPRHGGLQTNGLLFRSAARAATGHWGWPVHTRFPRKPLKVNPDEQQFLRDRQVKSNPVSS